MTLLIQMSIGVYTNGLPTGFAISTKIITLNTPIEDIAQIVQKTTEKMVQDWAGKKGYQLNLPAFIKPDSISIVRLD